jgi:hypothetical protein
MAFAVGAPPSVPEGVSGAVPGVAPLAGGAAGLPPRAVSLRDSAGGAVRASSEFPKMVAMPITVSPNRPTATTELVLTGTAGSIQSHR